MNEQGPFDRLLHAEPQRERRGGFVIIAILALGLLLLILVLPPISIFSNGGDSEGSVNIKTKARSEMPALPEGLEAISPLYDISVSGAVQGPTVITLKLPSPVSDPRNLALYTHEGGQWHRLANANLVLDGDAAQGEVAELPKNLTVLRRTSMAQRLAGWLPAGAELSPQAAQSLSVANTVDFAPARDGSLIGGGSPVVPGTGFEVYPTIRVRTAQDAEAVNGIMASPDLRDEHIDAILSAVESEPYDGIDLDYGQIDPLHKDGFSQFVTTLAEQIHRRGLGLTLTAPLPVQQGTAWDTGAYDWPRLAQAADAIKLATEPDPDRYYKRTEQALSFLIDEQKIAPGKLMLVVNTWSREKGGEGIRSLSLLEALALASTLAVENPDDIKPGDAVTIVGQNVYQDDGASGIQWNEEAAAVSFTYPGLGGARTVWIENAFSVAFKLDLVTRFHLGGVAVEDVSTNPGADDIWPVLQEFADTGKASLVKPNGNLLVPYWEADGGSLESGANGAVVWTAPTEPGTYQITLIVSDGLVRVGQRVSLTVQP